VSLTELHIEFCLVVLKAINETVVSDMLGFVFFQTKMTETSSCRESPSWAE
jgi:hypothetical protein